MRALPNYILDVPMPNSIKQPGRAGTENEIEITPAMIEAGLEALSDYTESDGSFSRLMAPEIVAAVLKSGFAFLASGQTAHQQARPANEKPVKKPAKPNRPK